MSQEDVDIRAEAVGDGEDDVGSRLKAVLSSGVTNGKGKGKGASRYAHIELIVCSVRLARYSTSPLQPFKKAAGLIIHGHNILLQMSQVLLLGAEHVNSNRHVWVELQVPRESDIDEEEDEVLARLSAEGKDRKAASRRRYL